MRDHFYHRHGSARSLIEASGIKGKKKREQKLARVKRDGMWAYVIVPADGSKCEIHFWTRADQDPRSVAMMIGHELGHIADGGPKDHLGYHGEENRADEFGRTAQETLTCLLALGLVTGPGGQQLSQLGPSPAGRLRKESASAQTGRKSRRPARRARRR